MIATQNGAHIEIERFDNGYMLHVGIVGASIHPVLTRTDMIALHDMIRAELRWPSDCPLDKVAA